MKYLSLFGKKKLNVEEYTGIRRDIDRAVGKMDALEQQMRARKDDMKQKGVAALKSQDESAFSIYSTHFQNYKNREKQLAQGKTTLDLIKVQVDDYRLSQDVEEVLGNVKTITDKVPETKQVYDQLENMQENLRQGMNADVYATQNKETYLQDWQKELKAEWEGQIKAEAQTAQGLEEKIRAKKTVEAETEA